MNSSKIKTCSFVIYVCIHVGIIDRRIRSSISSFPLIRDFFKKNIFRFFEGFFFFLGSFLKCGIELKLASSSCVI